MAIINKLIICLFVIYGGDLIAGHRRCSSCMLIRRCEEASYLMKSTNLTEDIETRDRFRRAFCGIVKVNNISFPQVCCSDFERIFDEEPAPERDIETHENFALLPETCSDVYSKESELSTDSANRYSAPWMTRIFYVTGPVEGRDKYEFGCAGTVINSRYILTAAQCVRDKRIAGVRVGGYKINSEESCRGKFLGQDLICEPNFQDIQVEKTIVHEDYNRSVTDNVLNVQNDVALLRLKKPLDFSMGSVKPICLPIFETLKNIDLNGTKASVTGWRIAENYGVSSVLENLTIPIKLESDCQEYYDVNSETDSMENKFCAGQVGQEFCAIAGSPLMSPAEYGSKQRMVQFGITSYGPVNCAAVPDVYTDVRKYVRWILDSIKE